LRRWLAVLVGVGIAGVALQALLHRDPAPPPHGDIDPRSRAELDAVIEREERR
jgi:hypothetical protein